MLGSPNTRLAGEYRTKYRTKYRAKYWRDVAHRVTSPVMNTQLPSFTTARRTRHDTHLGLFHRDQLRRNGVTIRLYWFGPLFASIITGRARS